MSYYNSGSRIDEGWGGRRLLYLASSGRDIIADHVEYLTSDSLLPEPRHSFSAHRTSVVHSTKIASVMALGSRSPWGVLGEEQK
jgi:hypothetical protein